MTIEPIKQQSLVPLIGQTAAERACLPTCFYMLGRAYGYLNDIELPDLIAAIEPQAYSQERGWLRARASHELRSRYGMSIVTWMLSPNPKSANFDLMVQAGYVETQREIAWYERNVEDWPVDVIVAAGTPVIATMKPGFGQNTFVHAVILAQLSHDRYEVIDPDERSTKRFYSIDEIHRSLSPVGAATVILPTQGA